MSASPSFGSSVSGSSPTGTERVATGQDVRPARDRRGAFADQDEREVGKRGEVTTRADRATARDARMHIAVEQLDQLFQRGAANAGVTLREDVRPQQHGRTHGAHRQWFADAGGMASQQIQLKGSQRAGWNRGLGKCSETRVDAVDGFAAGGHAVDDNPCRVHARHRVSRQSDAYTFVRNREQLGERQGGAVEQDHWFRTT